MWIQVLCLILLSFLNDANGICGASIRWSHNVNMHDVYGMWYGVGYAQHSQDMSDRPDNIGCVTLYITDATVDENEWMFWNIQQRDTSTAYRSWSNPWADTTAMSGSRQDFHMERRVKRNNYEERRVKVVWDEDGQTMERVYLYSVEEPGLWTAEKQWQPMEKAMRSRGVDIWYPDEPPYHPDIIRVLQVTPAMLIINRCSEVGTGGIVSLILRRSPEVIDRSEWYEVQRQLQRFELPYVQRYATVCAACSDKCVFVALYILLLFSMIL